MAAEVLLVILLVQECLTGTENGLLALGADDTEELCEMLVAIRVTVAFEEHGRTERLTANCASKMLRVPHTTLLTMKTTRRIPSASPLANRVKGKPPATYASIDTTTQNGLSALMACFLKHKFIVFKAVQLTFVLMAVTTNKSATALCATEVLRVHSLALECNPLTCNKRLTLGADLLSLCNV
jgi:hypothetical protein